MPQLIIKLSALLNLLSARRRRKLPKPAHGPSSLRDFPVTKPKFCRSSTPITTFLNSAHLPPFLSGRVLKFSHSFPVDDHLPVFSQSSLFQVTATYPPSSLLTVSTSYLIMSEDSQSTSSASTDLTYTHTANSLQDSEVLELKRLKAQRGQKRGVATRLSKKLQPQERPFFDIS